MLSSEESRAPTLTAITFAILAVLSATLHSENGVSAMCPLDSATFELVTDIRQFKGESSVDMTLEERYSGQQARGLVKFRAYGKADALSSILGDRDAATFYHDAKANVSLMYGDGSGTCEHAERRELARTIGLDIMPDSESEASGHLIGAARWLKYFCGRRSELKADLSNLEYKLRNVPGRRYQMELVDEHGTKYEVAVYYTEASLTAANHDSALPGKIVFFGSAQNSMVTMLTFSTVKFSASDFFEPAEGASSQLELDAFMQIPENCNSLIVSSTASQPIFERDRPRRASFLARYGPDTIQVAYDGHLGMMRVDTEAPLHPIRCSKQIFNFYRNKQYHVVERTHLRDVKLEHLLEGPEERPQPARLDFDGGAQSQDSGAVAGLGDSGTGFACASAQIATPATWRSLSPAELLLGSKSFAYLGRARVRGIRALVYGSVGSGWPYWFRAPVDASADPTGKVQRDGERSPIKPLVTRLYVSEVPADGRADDESQILAMEFFHMDPSFKFVYARHSISVYDFSWTLQAIKSTCSANEEDDATSLFSLADRCSDSQERGQVEMLLESVKPPLDSTAVSAQLAESPTELDLSVLSALQRDLNLLVVMMYDLEVKLIAGEQGSPPLASGNQEEIAGPPVRLVVTFGMARNSDVGTRLAYLGRGVAGDWQGESMRVAVRSLHQCFMLVSHRRSDAVDFAFDELSDSCFIALKQPGAGSDAPSAPFTLSTNGRLKVYRASKFADPQSGALGTLTDKQQEATKHVTLRHKTLTLDLNGLEMRVKRFNVRRYEKSHSLDGSSGLADNHAVKELAGFGLVEQAGLSQRAWPQFESGRPTQGGEPDEKDEELSLDQCEAQCLAYLNCKSVSYCVRGAHAECILSTVDMGDPELILRIQAHVAVEPNDKTFNVGLTSNSTDADGHSQGAQAITLVRRPGCAIYMKQVMRYFERDESNVVTSLQFVSLERARSVEQCASRCLETNLASLRAHHELLSGSLGRLEQTLASGARNSEQQDALNALEHLQESGWHIRDCRTFRFVNALSFFQTQSEKTIERFRKFATEIKADPALLDDVEELEPEGGFCLQVKMPRKASIEEIKQEPRLSFNLTEGLEFAKYDFDVANLYEEEHGVRLRGSTLTGDELKAYQEIVQHGKEMAYQDVKQQAATDAERPSVPAVGIVRRLLGQGENFQVITAASKHVCASMCFKQMEASLWPACRSFDLFVERAPSGRQALVKCALNSMTRRQLVAAGRTDLIDSTTWTANGSSPGLVHDCWHYEPRAGLLGAQTLAEEEGAAAALLTHGKSLLELYRNQLIYFFVTTAVGLGLFMGLMLTEHAKSLGYLSWQQKRRRQNRGNSISSTRALELDDEHLELPPIREEQEGAQQAAGGGS